MAVCVGTETGPRAGATRTRGASVAGGPPGRRAARPTPEPEERWALAPGHRHGPATDVSGEVPAEPVPGPPVKAHVARPSAEGSER